MNHPSKTGDLLRDRLLFAQEFLRHPFSAMDQDSACAIMEAIASQLTVGGRFLAYQVSTRVEQIARPFFPSPHVEVVYLNVPPLRIFRWTKHVVNG